MQNFILNMSHVNCKVLRKANKLQNNNMGDGKKNW